jgi:light-regulated signal transduction histidine kinase (bacteriophytochrome)
MILRDSKGKAIRVVGAISDITERKEFESSLKNLNEKLEARARELAASNAELEQFAYVASHDLQEPLRMVTSFLSQLETKYQDQLDERAKKYIHFAVDGAKRMRQIILDLLEFSRVGRMEEEVEEIEVSEIIDEVCTLQYSMIQFKNAIISCSKLPVIRGFRTPMIQVFQNLISNAIKYSKENVQPEVKISYRDLPGFWEFAVEDNGIGMDEDSFDRIFVIFQRLHTKDQFAGSGIGLAIVKKIIENLGGRIWVESIPGVGTTFRFIIKK